MFPALCVRGGFPGDDSGSTAAFQQLLQAELNIGDNQTQRRQIPQRSLFPAPEALLSQAPTEGWARD